MKGTTSATVAPTRSLKTQDNIIYMEMFAAFSRRCQFTDSFVSIDRDLFGLIQMSPMLHDIALGIGALEASRRPSCTRSHSPEKARAVAFIRYGNALHMLRHRLAKAEAIHSEDLIWCTFLFSLFEVSNSYYS